MNMGELRGSPYTTLARVALLYYYYLELVVVEQYSSTVDLQSVFSFYVAVCTYRSSEVDRVPGMDQIQMDRLETGAKTLFYRKLSIS
jgi:hypothetical protein